MRVERIEHIYLSDKEIRLWCDFGDLLQEIQRETECDELVTLISDISAKLLNLSDFWEGE